MKSFFSRWPKWVRVLVLALIASGTGTLVSNNETSFGFQTSGTLTKVNVAVGDQVTAGEVLAQLDDTTEQIALVQNKQALLELSPNNYAVFVMVGGKPTLRIVTVGLQDPTYAEIKTGVKAGDVVTTGIQATTANTGAGTTVTP